ncbi:MAG: 6-phosphogluconolactonase [Marmoricola sp.]|nr:6-phosphogluconolactonase [Marmoricola sp.]
MTTLEVSADAAALADTVAERLVARLAEIQSSGRVPAVALTGGTIADEIYRAVAARDTSTVDWKKVDFYWGDERYVPADSSDRNDRAVGLELLDVVLADPARVHAMPASDEAHEDLEEAALAYEQLVRETGGGEFDLVLLGLGPDGHVASLFPGFPQLDVDDRIAVAVTGSPKPPPERISLTFPALNRTREVWFLVSADGKADAVARSLAPEGTVHATPARGITVDNTTWFLDTAAASLL